MVLNHRPLTWVKKFLRKVHGPTYKSVSWKFKTNKDISNNFKPPGTLTVIKVRRLEWCGRVVRMDGERKIKKLLEGKSGGGRKDENLDKGGWMMSDSTWGIWVSELEIKSFRQNRVGICRGESQGQTSSDVVLKKKKNTSRGSSL